jgi:4'-phosphopantetheinyl transferase
MLPCHRALALILRAARAFFAVWTAKKGELELHKTTFEVPDGTLFEKVLASNEVHVWHTDLHVKYDYVASLFELLDCEEQQRASRFRVSSAREQFVISHAFLRLVLAEYLQTDAAGVRFHIAPSGKPESIDDKSIRFNLSHSEGAAAIAITRDRAVGIDIEGIREDVEVIDLADRFFSPAEAEWLRSQPASERIGAFFSCWTAKEALLKACGIGLLTSLSGFSVIPGPENEQIKVDICGNDCLPKNWSVWQLNLGPALCAALALQETNITIRCQKWVWPHEFGN